MSQIPVYNSASELIEANRTEESMAAMLTWNMPHISFADGKDGIDFCIELYALPEYDITTAAERKQLYDMLASRNKPFYAEIPSTLTKLSGKGEIVVFDV